MEKSILYVIGFQVWRTSSVDGANPKVTSPFFSKLKVNENNHIGSSSICCQMIVRQSGAIGSIFIEARVGLIAGKVAHAENCSCLLLCSTKQSLISRFDHNCGDIKNLFRLMLLTELTVESSQRSLLFLRLWISAKWLFHWLNIIIHFTKCTFGQSL